jgi:hypothetical protein
MNAKEVVANIKTNQDMIHYIMNYIATGALAEIFVIEALRFYSERITQQGEPTDDKPSLISPIAWYKTAVEIENLLKAKYEPDNK